MTNEEYQKLLELGTTNEDLAQQISMQNAQAKYLRSLGGPPQMRDVGRVVKAPHWMELLGALAQQKAAVNQQNKAMEGQKQVVANRQAQNAMIMRALLEAQGQPAPSEAVGPGMNPAGGGQGMKIPYGMQ